MFLSISSCAGDVDDPLRDDEHETLAAGLLKQLGGSNGDGDYCNTGASLCAAGEGDCDGRGHCLPGLQCVQNVGALYGFSAGTDVCAPETCFNGQQDPGEDGVDCQDGPGACGECAIPRPGTNGDADYCTFLACGGGQGDCDSDAECLTGLTCVQNVGAFYGLSSGVDVCSITSCFNGLQDPGEDGVDCQNGAGACADCGAPRPGTNGDADYCSIAPCLSGQGDCDSSAECAGDLICTENAGAAFGFSLGLDVCLPAHCSNGVLDGAQGEAGVDAGGPCGNVPAHCSNGVLDAGFGEEDVDCGGPCLACAPPVQDTCFQAFGVSCPEFEQAYVKSSHTANVHEFGFSVAIDGDTMVVGARREAGGAVYVFERVGSTWSQQAYLKAPFADSLDFFGRSVAIDGDTLVVGATGEDSAATGINNGAQADNSAPDAGAVYVFERVGSTWSQQAYLKASNASSKDWFGVQVAIDGDTIVVGAPGEDSDAAGVNGDQTNNSSTNAGAVYVFQRVGSAWSQQAYLKASNPGSGYEFGRSVALDGATIVVGAPGEASPATGVNGDQTQNSARDAGAVYVFQRVGSTWSQQAYLKASTTDIGIPDAGIGDEFGYSVAIDGDTVAVGAWGEDSAATGVNGDQADNSARDAGAVYVFQRVGSTWSQQAYLKASNTNAKDRFGRTVAVDGDTLVVGVPFEDSFATSVNGDQADNSSSWSGAVYVFQRVGSTWSQQAYLKASNTGWGDQFGESVAIDRGTLVVGSPGEDSAATGINGDQEDNSLHTGAVYVRKVLP